MNQKRAKVYSWYRILLSLLGLVVSCTFFSVVQFTGISFRLSSFALHLADNLYLALPLYLICLNLAYYVIALPLDFYSDFVLEHRFSLSNQTPFGWFKEDAKKVLVSGVLSLLLIEIFYAVAWNFRSNWWWVCASIWIIFSILLSKIFPVVIIPIFYKYSALKNEDLRRRILEMADKFKVKVMDVFEIDFSKNTKKSNAAVIGWGKTRRVILADNLLNEFTPEEVEVVVAHEMAHYKLNHIAKFISISAVSTFIYFFLLKCFAQNFLAIQYFPGLMLSFIIYGLITMPFHNAMSRFMETNADRMALEITKKKEHFITLMEKLADKNLSDTDPNRLVEIIFYDHPSIARRIELAKIGRAR